MKIADTGEAPTSPYLSTLDLNDLLLDHPAASFVFQVGSRLAIVDRAAIPEEDCLVMVQIAGGFAIETYRRQVIFGVITYLIKRAL